MPNARTTLALAALAAGLAAMLNRSSARRAERDNPPEGRFVEVAGTRLHYLEAGHADGVPVVLLHGNAVRAEDWVASGVFGLLVRRGYRVLAFDRPGYGYSDRPRGRIWTAEAQAAALADAFARLGVEKPVVVGHSWGTLVAIALGLDHPDAVSGLVLASGYHFPTLRADVALFSPPALPVLGDVLRYTVAPLLGRLIAPRMIRDMFAPLPVPPAFKREVPIALMVRPWQIRASAEDAATMTPRTMSVDERYGELARRPVAILAGARDRIVDVGRHSVRLHRMLPGSTLQVLPQLGHMIHYGAPELVADAVDAVGSAAGEAPASAEGARRQPAVAYQPG